MRSGLTARALLELEALAFKDSEGVELRVKSGAVGIARVHQEGSVGYVGKTRARKTIRARYERRQLLGFATQDLDALTEELLGWLDRDK